MDLQTRINIAQHMDGPAYWVEMEEIRRQMRQMQPHPVTVDCAVSVHIKPRPIEEQVAAFLSSDRAAALSERDCAYLKKLAKIPV
jgi:hypothetical protein